MKIFSIITKIGLALLIGVFFVILDVSSVHASSVISRPPNNLGLIAYWSFEDATGTIATDFSGNGHTGTLHAMEVEDWVTGRRGRALQLDGVAEYVDTAFSPSIDFTTSDSFAFSVWYRPATTTGTHYIMQFDNPDLIHLYQNGTSAIFRIRSDAGSLSTATATNVFTAGQWYHLVGVRDVASDTVILYVNGVEKASATDQSTATITMPSLHFGRQSTTFTNGTIDEIRIYNRLITSTEAAALFNSGIVKIKFSLEGPTDGLIGFWTFNGDKVTATTVADSSGNGTTGTIVGSPKPVLGKNGQAFYFPGSGSYIDFGLPAVLDINTSAVTLSAWVKFGNIGTAAAGGIISKGENASFLPQYTLQKQSSIGLRFQINTTAGFSSPTINNPSPALNNTDWFHIVGVYNGTDLRIYVNGVLQGSPVSHTGTLVSNGEDVTIGVYDKTSTLPFVGTIDEARIYNRALSANEVQELYEGHHTQIIQ